MIIFLKQHVPSIFRGKLRILGMNKDEGPTPGGTKELLEDSEADGVLYWLSRRPCDLTILV